MGLIDTKSDVLKKASLSGTPDSTTEGTNNYGNNYRTTYRARPHGTFRMESSGEPCPGCTHPAPPRFVCARPEAWPGTDRGSMRTFSGLLEEPNHERDDRASPGTRGGGRPARTDRRYVRRLEDQPDGRAGRAACGAARAAHEVHFYRRQGC